MNQQVSDRLRAQLAFLAAFFGLVGLCSAGLTALYRTGLPIPWLLLAMASALLVSATLAPFLLPSRLQDRCWATPFLVPLTCLAMLLLPVLGLVVGPLIGWVTVAGAAVALYRARQAFAALRLGNWIFIALAAPLLSLYLFGTYNQLGHATIYSPELALTGQLKNDSYLHTTLARMIQDFGRASPGYDGLGSIPYHYGSHIWLAALASIGRSQPLFAYPVGQLVVAIPFLFWALASAVVTMGRGEIRSVALLLSGILIVAVLFDQVSWTSYYISESFTLSLGILLCLVPLLFDLIEEATRSAGLERLRWAVALSFGFLLAAVKLSVGLLWGVAVAYLLLRRPQPWSPRALASLAFLAGSLLLAFYLFRRNATGVGGGFAPFYMFGTGYLRDGIAASLLLPAVAMALALLRLGPQSFGSLGQAIRDRRTLGLEVLAAVTAAALLPGSVMVMASGNWWYFVNVAHWLAFPAAALMLAGGALGGLSSDLGRRLVAIPLAVLFGAWCLWLIWPLGIPAKSVLRAGLAPVAALAKQVVLETKTPIPPDSIPGLPPFFPAEIATALADTPGARLATMARTAAEGRRDGFALFVPPDNRAFWELTPWCATAPLLVPAITGLPLLYGRPAADRDCTDLYNGFHAFPDAETRDLTAEQLCLRAQQRHIERVYILRSLTEPGQNETLTCPPA